MDNPKATIESLLESEKTLDGIMIYPITLARYGLLEIIESPFVTKDKLFNVINLIPSLYVMSMPIDTLKKYSLRNINDLFEDSVIWSETLQPYQIEKAIKEIDAKLKTMFTVSPETSTSESETHKGKKVQTAG